MRTRVVHVVAAALVLAGCATAAKPREVLSVAGAPTVKAEDLAQCRALGEVHGEGVGGWGTTRDQQQYWARKDVANLAEKRGATHVEIVSELDDPNRLTVDGVAYRCGP